MNEKEVAPFTVPRLVPYAFCILAVAIALFCIPLQKQAEAKSVTTPDHIIEIADDLKQTMLEDIKDELAKDPDENKELKELLTELDEMIKEMDHLLSEAESEQFMEVARGVIGKAKENLGVEFKLAIQDRAWDRASIVGQRIIDEFPNSRMAGEVRDHIDTIRERASSVSRG